MCLEFLKEEFQLKNFGLYHQHPHLFVLPQYCCKELHILWTIFWGIYHLVWLLILTPFIVIRYEGNPGGLWFTYFTNWSYILLTLTTTIEMITTFYIHLKRGDIIKGSCDHDQLPWYLKMFWVFFNLSHSTGLMATIGYYTSSAVEFSAKSVATHMVNSIYILLNTIVSAKPMRILHFYQPLIVVLVYGIFNVVYQKFGGHPVYSILDLSNVTRTALCITGLAVLGAPFLHVTLLILHKLKAVVAFSCCCGKTDSEISFNKENNSVKDNGV